MLKQLDPLDAMFQALSDPSRRRMVERLSRGPASVSELAAPLAMSMSAVMQHLTVLEQSGIVSTSKIGRVRSCQLEPRAMSTAEQWITTHKQVWEKRLDRLDQMLRSEL